MRLPFRVSRLALALAVSPAAFLWAPISHAEPVIDRALSGSRLRKEGILRLSQTEFQYPRALCEPLSF